MKSSIVGQTGELTGKDGETLRPRISDHITVNTRERYGQGLRWKLGINTSPCIQSRRGKRCVFCGFLNNHSPISASAVISVFKEAVSSNDLNNVHRLEIYVSGSFFDDEEVSPDSRRKIIELVGKTDIKEVVLESRPEFITENSLLPFKHHINPNRVTIAVGVETTNSRVRSKLCKGLTTRELKSGIRQIKKAGMNFQAYLLLNPPVINNDREAVIDIVRSAEEIVNLASRIGCPLSLALQPFFLAENSFVAQERSLRDHTRPPWLYTIALTLKLLDIIRNKDGYRYQIILGNEIDNVNAILIPSNYTREGDICSCTDTLRGYLSDINISQEKLKENVDRVLYSECDCKTTWQNEIGADFGKLLTVNPPD
jgi:radical SAM enzyme (TIGR01210 family)